MVQHPQVEILEEKISEKSNTPFLIRWRFKEENHIRCFFPTPGYFLEKYSEEVKEQIIQDGFTFHVEAAIQHPENCPFPVIPFGTSVEIVTLHPYPVGCKVSDDWKFSHWDLNKHEANEWIFYAYRIRENGNIDHRASRSEMLLSYEIDGVKTILNTLEKYKQQRQTRVIG